MVHPLSCLFALGFVVAGFALLLIEDRATGIKHLQLVCGMSRLVYWLCAYVWDFLWYCAFCVLLILFFVVFRDPTYISAANLPVFIFILFLYGFAAIPWIYMFFIPVHISSDCLRPSILPQLLLRICLFVGGLSTGAAIR